MTSKEAYNVLLQAWQGNKEAKDYPSFDDINEALYIIKEALDVLEILRKYIRVEDFIDDETNIKVGELITMVIGYIAQDEEDLSKIKGWLGK